MNRDHQGTLWNQSFDNAYKNIIFFVFSGATNTNKERQLNCLSSIGKENMDYIFQTQANNTGSYRNE